MIALRPRRAGRTRPHAYTRPRRRRSAGRTHVAQRLTYKKRKCPKRDGKWGAEPSALLVFRGDDDQRQLLASPLRRRSRTLPETGSWDGRASSRACRHSCKRRPSQKPSENTPSSGCSPTSVFWKFKEGDRRGINAEKEKIFIPAALNLVECIAETGNSARRTK